MEHEVIRRLRAAMQGAGYDALVAFSQDNVTYTAGFLVPSHASNRFRRTITVLAGDAFAAQIVVNVEENLARSRSRFSDIRAYNQFTDDPADVLADALVEAGVASGRIAIELDYMPAQDYIRLRERLPAAQLVPCRELYFNVRMIKTEEEIAVLKAVGALTDRVAGEALGEVRAGMTEKSLAQIIGNRMLEGGCEGLSVLIGARETCKSMLKPGTAVADLYRTYVDYLRARGIEPTLKFLGHGIGQTIHEEPYITDTRAVILAPNITCTMEPLYMIPGRMGFHVEDMYRITPAGFEAITGTITPNDELIRVG